MSCVVCRVSCVVCRVFLRVLACVFVRVLVLCVCVVVSLFVPLFVFFVGWLFVSVCACLCFGTWRHILASLWHFVGPCGVFVALR